MFRRPIISVLALMIGMSACSNTTVKTSDSVISKPAELSFHMVRKESNSEAAMRLALEGKVPPGAAFFKERDGEGLIVERRTKITQDCLKDISSSRHPTSDAYILNFKFDKVCTKLFGEATAKNIGKRFAVVLNDEIITAPRINGAITAGTGFVEGKFTKQDVKAIVGDLLPYIKRNKSKRNQE